MQGWMGGEHISHDNRKISVTTPTLPYVSGSCERQSELSEMSIPLRPIPREDSSSWPFPSTGSSNRNRKAKVLDS